MALRGAVYVNGDILGQRTRSIPVFDHGFLYGEGVYETLRTYNGVPFLFDRHMRRLRASAGKLALDVPFTDDELAAGRTTRWPRPATRRRSLHPHPADARRRRADLRPGRRPAPSLVIIVKPLDEPPREAFERRRHGRAGVILRNHPGIGEPDDQVEQPAEQRAGDAGGATGAAAKKG